MKTRSFKKSVLCVVSLILALATSGVSQTTPSLPNPVLIFTGAEYFELNGKQMTRYRYDVFNRGAYPTELFAASPALPPCGQNNSASRTWVDIYDQRGKRLNGFCALGKPENLNSIWFALETDTIPPSWIYIEMNDRQTNTKYKSNLAETTL